MDKEKKIELKVTGNFWLSALIVAIRALQPNAQPMSEWSAFSWFLMTLPVTYVFLLFALVGILLAVGHAMDILLSVLRKRPRK